MAKTTLRRWLALSAVTMLIVTGCAKSSGATAEPPSASTAPAASTPASSAPSAAASVPASVAPSAAATVTCKGAGDKGTVQLMINQWVGAAANVAVAQCLLQQMGYKVATNTLAEEVAWQGFATGEVDVILENWGHPDLEKKYITDQKLAQDAGSNGVTGIIGWYVPGWMVDQYPDITDWHNLNKYASLFKTSESGDKGQFLGADPTFVQYDQALITNLGLNFVDKFSGSEAATITAFQQADKNKTPLIGYFYEPQWFMSEIQLVKVNLPAYTTGCDADPKAIACDYPAYALDKVVSKKFADSGSPAVNLVKKFSWTNEDQNLVAKYISEDKMTPEAAADKWIAANPDKVKAWIS